MVGVSRLFLPLVASEFHVLGTLWQEIHRYWQRRDRFSTHIWQNRTNSIEITWRNSCKIATAVKSATPACCNLLGSCHSEFRVLDLFATSGKHDLNPSLKKMEKSMLNASNVTYVYKYVYKKLQQVTNV